MAEPLREHRDGYWEEWFCDPPPLGVRYRVYPGQDEWRPGDGADGEPVRRIYQVELIEETAPQITAGEFEAAYAARSNMTVDQLRAAGRVVVACACGDELCQGWASIRPADRAEEWTRLHGPEAQASG
jgi:hypothetical protein